MGVRPYEHRLASAEGKAQLPSGGWVGTPPCLCVQPTLKSELSLVVSPHATHHLGLCPMHARRVTDPQFRAGCPTECIFGVGPP